MNDLDRRLEELFSADARGRRVQRVLLRPRGGRVAPFLLSAAVVATAAVALVAGLAYVRRGDEGLVPATSPSPAPSPSAVMCEDRRQPGDLPLAEAKVGQHVTVSVDRVSTSPEQGQWRIRYFVHGSAPGAATLGPQIAFTAGPVALSPLIEPGVGPPYTGFERFGSERQIRPCEALVMFVSTAPVVSGSYRIALRGLTPPGSSSGAVAEIAVDLSCRPNAGDCVPAAQALATPSASPDASLLRQDALIVFDGVRTGYGKGFAPLVKRETAVTAVGELAPSFFNQAGGVVSPDGRRFAYWAQPQGQPEGLYLLDAASPNTQTRLLTIGAERPAGLTWSVDGLGLLFSTTDSNQGTRPTFASLRTFVIATGETREVLRLGEGVFLGPVAWDPAAGRIAATEQPDRELRLRYHLIEGSQRRAIDLDALGVAGASPDARSLLLTSGNAATGRTFALYVAPIDDPKAAREILRSADPVGLVIGWRAGSGEVLFYVPSGVIARYEAVDVETGRRREIGRYPVPDGPVLMRPDGSGILIGVPGRIVVVDLASGRSTELREDAEGRRPRASLSAR